MTLTQKQLGTAVKNATANLATKKDLQAVEDNMARTVNEGFQQVEDRIADRLDGMDRKLDRIENIVSSWPAPSAIKGLLERVGRLEEEQRRIKKKVGITS